MNELNPSLGRRGLFRLGGLTVGTAALLAACGGSEAGEIGTVGEGVADPGLATGTVDNSILLRTMASVETSIATAYARIVADGLLGGASSTYPALGDQSDLVTQFAEHHTAAAATYNELAVAAGGEAWTCGNPRLDAVYIGAILARVTEGTPATDTAKEIAASDDVLRDMANLVHTLESLSAASGQALVNQVTEAPMRVAAVEVASRSARQAALLALRLNPGGYLPLEATENTIPVPVAKPTAFGSIGAVTWVGGAGDENGVRMRVNFETPSLNSMVYDFVEYGECMPTDMPMDTAAEATPST